MKKKIYLKGHINEKKFKVDITPPIPSPYLKRFIPPHQEGWREKFQEVAYHEVVYGNPIQTGFAQCEEFIEQLLLSAHSADITAFWGMIETMTFDDLNNGIQKIGKKPSYTGPISQARLDGFQVSRRLLSQKLQEYEKEGK